MIVAGHDPGKTGATALVNTQTGTVNFVDTPTWKHGSRYAIDIDALWARLYDAEITRVMIEHVHARPQDSQNPGGFGAMMRMFGAAETILRLSGAEVFYVTPATWKRKLGLNKTTKADAVDLARTLYSGLPKRLRHDKAEALLLAHYGLTEVWV